MSLIKYLTEDPIFFSIVGLTSLFFITTFLFFLMERIYLKKEHQKLLNENQDLKNQWQRLSEEKNEWRTRHAELQILFKEKESILEQTEAKLLNTFKSISSEALKNSTQTFLDLATTKLEKWHESAKGDLQLRQHSIHELVNPIKQSLEKVDKNLFELEKSRIASYTSLNEQVFSLAKTQQELQKETSNLVNALKMPQVRGRWGEVQLQRVVEIAGMVEHCDFQQQPHLMTETGALRPDLIVQLPNNRKIVVDSKVVLKAYLEALTITDDELKREKFREHAKQVRARINDLSAKKYWEQFQEAPEFVVLFLPGESFYSSALEYDPELIEWGFEQKVVISTPSTLIALLRAIAYGWKQEQLSRNTEKAFELGKELYERLKTMVDHFEDMRKGLDRATDAYNRAVGSFEGRVMIAARRFTDLGISTEQEIKIIEPIDKVTRELKAS